MLLTLFITFNSCKKDSNQHDLPTPIGLQEAKNYINNYLNKSSTNVFSKMNANWNTILENKQANDAILEVSLNNPERIFQTSSLIQKVEDNEKRNNVRLILFKNNATSKINYAVYMSIINDGEPMDLTKIGYKQSNTLTGKILFYNLEGKFINGWHYTKGKIDQSISPSTEEAYKQSLSKINSKLSASKSSNTGNDKKISRYDLPEIICHDELVPTYGVACVEVAGLVNCQLYQTGSDYVTYCEYVDQGGGNSGGGTAPGGGGSTGSNNIPSDPYMPGQDHAAIDPKKFIKCFENIPNAGATYKVIVQVQEPVPGTSFNWGPVNGVGHTAITLIKQGSNGMKVTQTLGFYPAGNKFSGPSKMVNNSDETEFTIRMEISMGNNSVDFNKILSGVANPPSSYQLLGMNCTAFVVSVCGMGGLTLPNATTTVGPPTGPGGSPAAMTPGGLGYSMRAASAQGDGRISSGAPSTGNNPASNGPCN